MDASRHNGALGKDRKTHIYSDIKTQIPLPLVNVTRLLSTAMYAVTEGMKQLKYTHLGTFARTDTQRVSDSRCSFFGGMSVCVCRRGRYGEGRGSGMDETSWVWRGYQWGLSSSKAVSSSIRICSYQNIHRKLLLIVSYYVLSPVYRVKL